MLTSSERFARVTFRLAKPMLAYSIIFLVVSFLLYVAPILSALSSLFVLVVIAIIIVVTIFLILLDEGFRNGLKDTTELTKRIVEASHIVYKYAIFVAVGAIVFAAFAAIASYSDRANPRRKKSLVSSLVVLGLSVAFSVVYLTIPMI